MQDKDSIYKRFSGVLYPWLRLPRNIFARTREYDDTRLGEAALCLSYRTSSACMLCCSPVRSVKVTYSTYQYILFLHFGFWIDISFAGV